MHAKIYQPIKALAINQRFKLGAYANVRRWLTGLRVTHHPDGQIRACHCLILHLGLKGQHLILARTAGLEIHRHERRIIHRDPNLFHRGHEEVFLPFLLENR